VPAELGAGPYTRSLSAQLDHLVWDTLGSSGHKIGSG